MFTLRGSFNNLPEFAVFEGAIPNPQEIAEIRARGWGMHFVELPAQHLDLAFLYQYADFLTHLSIADAGCRDVGPILELRRLRALSLYTDQQADVDLTRLAELEDFHGQHARFESVVNCPKLRRLALQGVDGTKLGEIRAPVEYLELIDARRLRALPFLYHPEKLDQLWILGSRELDLSGISRCTSLREIALENCGSVTGLNELRDLPNLKGIGLIGCRELTPKDALLGLMVESISVFGKNPFDADFRAKAVESATRWVYHGSARKPSR